MSLVRMLRKCMSLRRVARFTVVSFVDCEDNREGLSYNLATIVQPLFVKLNLYQRTTG